MNAFEPYKDPYLQSFNGFEPKKQPHRANILKVPFHLPWKLSNPTETCYHGLFPLQPLHANLFHCFLLSIKPFAYPKFESNAVPHFHLHGCLIGMYNVCLERARAFGLSCNNNLNYPPCWAHVGLPSKAPFF